MPLAKALSRACEGDAGRWVHWGATTQDIIDTGLVLQLRDGFELIREDLRGIEAALEDLARRYRDTPMAGRTHAQHALPITFGFKCALWLAPLQRHSDRLARLSREIAVVQFGGAVGTLASLGTDGIRVLAALAEELGLDTPPIAWHVGRDGLAEVASFLGLLTGSLGKIATDVALLMQAEIGEVAEPYQEGRGGSSTMPQKRNPIACEFVLACARNVRQLVAVMLDAMVQDHERATGPWHAEWIALPQAFALTAGALHHARTMLEGLVVDPERMRSNLDTTRGMISAEAVMMALAPEVGREKAHHLVAAACQRALAHDRHLLEELQADAAITAHLRAGATGRAARSGQLHGACRRLRRSRPGVGRQQSRVRGESMPKIHANGIQLHYELSGPADAPVVMLSNSLGTRLEMWDPQMQALTERYRVLRYDSRGHGRSDAPDGPYTIDLLADDALGLLDALDIERVHFCGLSKGGMVGQVLGAQTRRSSDQPGAVLDLLSHAGAGAVGGTHPSGQEAGHGGAGRWRGRALVHRSVPARAEHRRRPRASDDPRYARARLRRLLRRDPRHGPARADQRTSGCRRWSSSAMRTRPRRPKWRRRSKAVSRAPGLRWCRTPRIYSTSSRTWCSMLRSRRCSTGTALE